MKKGIRNERIPFEVLQFDKIKQIISLKTVAPLKKVRCTFFRREKQRLCICFPRVETR